MKRVILFEDDRYRNLLPLVYWRTVGELRCGVGTLAQNAARALASEFTDLWVRLELESVASERHGRPINRPIDTDADGEVLLVNARYVPSDSASLPTVNTIGVLDGQIAFVCAKSCELGDLSSQACLAGRAPDSLPSQLTRIDANGAMINYPWNLFDQSEKLLARTSSAEKHKSATISPAAHLINPQAIAIQANAKIAPGAVLDATDGPILIGTEVTISPLAVIQGPCFIGTGSVIHPGAVIRHGCSIGPRCKLGGEIEATIIQGHTNKQHDGFLGHAFLGEWVNLGADTVNSDLKNTYGPVRVPINGTEIDSGRMFLGMFVADHAKTGINQSIATGSVIGFAASVASSTFPEKFVPSFTWATDNGSEAYDLERCISVAKKVMLRRDVAMSAAEEALFRRLPRVCRAHERTEPAP